jgi:hypothetical protein
VQTALECIPCFARQALEAARLVTDDSAVHEQLLRDVLRLTADCDLALSPPAVAQQIHRRLRELAGHADPYRDAKQRFNEMAMAMVPELSARIGAAASPFVEAVKLAIAGNVIDLGIDGNMTVTDARRAIAAAADEPFHGDMDALARAVDEAESILYLADNAGEIVFDRLLVERLLHKRVCLAVRGGPVLNDATGADAEAVGLTDLVEVIDNGSDAPGTLLEDCSPAFRERFETADLILAKGQGNFETLSDTPGNLWFLFKAKCPVAASLVGLPIGTHVAITFPARWSDHPQETSRARSS